MATVDFNVLSDNGRINYLSGKKKGLAAREELGLDAYDTAGEQVDVIIPTTLDCNESFLGGVFSNSIAKYGSRSSFLEKYHFRVLTDLIAARLDNVITATLSLRTGLSDLRE